MNIYLKEGGKEEISNKGVVSQAEIINNHLLFSDSPGTHAKELWASHGKTNCGL